MKYKKRIFTINFRLIFDVFDDKLVHESLYFTIIFVAAKIRFFYLQRKQLRTSIGSTSCAITTKLAFLVSTRLVMWLIPYLMVTGFFVFDSFPAAFVSASCVSLCFFSALVSGRYLWSSLKSCVATRNTLCNNDFHEISDFESKTISVPVTDPIYFLFQKYQHPNTLGKLHYDKTAEFFN